MKRLIVALLVGGAIFGAVFAAAAALNVDAGFLQAGSDDTLVCDADGVQIFYQDGWSSALDDFAITGVVVAGIDDTCDGKLVEVVLTDVNGNWLASGATTIPVVGNATVDTSPDVLASAVYDVHVIIR